MQPHSGFNEKTNVEADNRHLRGIAEIDMKSNSYRKIPNIGTEKRNLRVKAPTHETHNGGRETTAEEVWNKLV